MIDYETFIQIKKYQEEGLSVGQIAQKLIIDSRTADKWMQVKKYCQRQSATKTSKLDPFKDDIISSLEKHPYSAQQIYQRIKENDFDGSYSTYSVQTRKYFIYYFRHFNDYESALNFVKNNPDNSFQ